FSRGHFFGTTHTYLGQEANAVGVLRNIAPEDIVVSNHRSHGHFLAYGGDMRALFAELMGKSTGVSGGRGGSQHLHWRNFFSNGVLGGTVPIAVGMALAEKIQGRSSIAINFLGDGTMGEGVVYESINMASLWSVPILFVVENNRIAQTTPVELNLAGDIPSRFTAFGIKTTVLDSSDAIEIGSTAQQMMVEVRNESAPQSLVINTHRFGPHSKGDDTRDEDQIRAIRNSRDPIPLLAKSLTVEKIDSINEEVEDEVLKAFQAAVDDPFPEILT
ncbi:MAG: thiamine pyrophosphate-dependent dehydrogenase E1 component subunit alpha, partial [Chloroflexota bacterium]